MAIDSLTETDSLVISWRRDELVGCGFRLPLAAAVAGLGWVLFRWLRHELRAPATPGQRAPRLFLMGSTLLLFAVFLIHGPVIGYLCFGTAHAIEYMAFVHHYGARKYAGEGGRGRGPAALLGDPRVAAPALMGGLLLVFWLLHEQRRTEVYLVYYTATSWLHFLYDGWIWKVRRPELARTLELAPSAIGAARDHTSV